MVVMDKNNGINLKEIKEIGNYALVEINNIPNYGEVVHYYLEDVYIYQIYQSPFTLKIINLEKISFGTYMQEKKLLRVSDYLNFIVSFLV